MTQARILVAPLSGWVGPLVETPDPVFAEGMMGLGVAIDPTGGVLCAPCAARVVKVHAARHAVTLETPEGAEILLHLGLETVGLNGAAFKSEIGDGDLVETGQVLIRFDIDHIARAARSAITPVLVTNPDAFEIEILATGREIAAGEPLLRLTSRKAGATRSEASGPALTRRLWVTHPHGLHARPAARIAAEARRWSAKVEITSNGRRADAASPISVMILAVAAGDALELSARGQDAAEALDGLAAVFEQINDAPVHAAPEPAAPPVGDARSEGHIQGVRAAPGVAAGLAWRPVAAQPPPLPPLGAPSREADRLHAGLAAAAADLRDKLERLSGEGRAVVAAHLVLLEDQDLVRSAQAAIASGLAADLAWRGAVAGQADRLRATGEPRLVERAVDLEDLERRVLWAMAGARPEPPRSPVDAILLADDLMPSDLAEIDATRLLGLCTAGGGPTSHVSILAAAMGVPAVVAAGPRVLAVADGAPVILDGDNGCLEVDPTPARLAAVRLEANARVQAHERARVRAAEPARLADGTRIEVFANIGSLAEARLAAREGAEGCGLLRTEFLFLDRTAAPSEDEQVEACQAVAEALPGRPVIVRTLDVGGDKPAPYLDIGREDNPSLGVRGLRVGLRRPELLRSQLRAILRLRPQGQCRIMAPMVASLAEVVALKALVARCAAELGRTDPIQVGVMIETPAAAVTCDLICTEADFISIGTNDLTQYALAMDRGNPALAPEVDALHPAVLRLIRLAADGARRRGRPVGVCGALASDAAAVPILIGLGVGELSVTPSRIASTKAQIRTLDGSACRDLGARACDLTSAAEVRALAQAAAAGPA